MKKKYQVFVSSTYLDLKEERMMITQALLESDCIPAGMELFSVSGKRTWDVIKNVIDDSDYYLLVLAGKYGSIDKNTQMSYTEMEYEYAKSINKPILAFLYNDIDNLPAKKVESTPRMRKKLEQFRKKVKDPGLLVAFWSTPDELISKLKSSIVAITKDSPSNVWIKLSHPVSSDIDHWELVQIFDSRAEKNKDSDPRLETHDVKKLDGIAFGLTSFRCKRSQDLLSCLQSGMNVRFLVMDPKGDYIHQRESEENVARGSIEESINQLVIWAKELNDRSDKGKIQIKGYSCMTLDFYWRIDDVVYVGPYLYNIASQQTITYKYGQNGRGFKFYTRYFEELWYNDKLCRTLL